MSGPDGAPALADLLVRSRGDLLALVRREAGGLLRYETADDLVQGIHLRAIERAEGFEYRGDGPFLAWLRRTASSFLSDRRSHWGALKRRSGRLLRLTSPGSETRDPSAAAEPAATSTGPSTFAARRELLTRAVRTLEVLLPRDRDLVRWTTESVPLEEQARRLGVSYDAAERARLRALERFRRAFQVASGFGRG